MRELIKTGKSHRENDLGRDDIRRLVPGLALPAMLAQFINVLYSIIDRMYIGNIPHVGELALAGAGICGPIVTMLSAFAAWVGIGGAPLMSIKMGQGNKKEAEGILANCFLMMLVMSVALTIVAYLYKNRLLLCFGATESILPYADAYLSVYLAGTLFAILSLGLNQFIICQGYAGLGMLSVVIGAVINILLDPVFIFALNMGVTGAALATVLSQMASCAFTLSILFGHKTPVGITFGNYKPLLCLRVLLVGLTPFLIILFDNILIIVQNIMLKAYGGSQSDLLLTCNTIVQSFMLMVTMPLSGITGGTQSILGYNYGAGNHARIRQAERYIIATGLIFCTIMFLAARFGSAVFVRIFTQDPLYIERTVSYIRIYTLGVIPLAVQYAIVDGFTGMSLPQAALPLSFFRKGLYIALVILLCIFWGADKLFWAEPVSDIISPIVSSVTYLAVLPKLLRRIRPAR